MWGGGSRQIICVYKGRERERGERGRDRERDREREREKKKWVFVRHRVKQEKGDRCV